MAELPGLRQSLNVYEAQAHESFTVEKPAVTVGNVRAGGLTTPRASGPQPAVPAVVATAVVGLQ